MEQVNDEDSEEEQEKPKEETAAVSYVMGQVEQHSQVLLETNSRLKKKIVDLIKTLNQLQDEKVQVE